MHHRNLPASSFESLRTRVIMTNSKLFFTLGYRLILIMVISLFIFTIVINEPLPESSCKIEENSADCSAHRVSPVLIPPSKLLVELKILNLSSNVVNNFSTKNMKRYKHLSHLYMKNVDFEKDEITNNENWFVDLVALEELDMSGTDFRIGRDQTSYTLNCFWPKKLKKLILSDMGIDNIAHISSLNELEYLDISKNNFGVFPEINSNAPLKYLILSKNPLANITISHIAPFCELITLNLQSMVSRPNLPSFMSPRQSCSCNLLKLWMKQYDIANDFDVQCAPADRKCKLEFDIGSKTARNDCLDELPITSVFELLLFAILFLILVPMLYFVNEAWNRYQTRSGNVYYDPRRQRSTSPDHENDHFGTDDSMYSEYESVYEKFANDNTTR